MDWRDKSVLVIDDEQHMRWLLAALYRHRGATVHLAGDGQAGLRNVNEMCPDLVILDILLPGMNGLEVLQIIRQTSEVPVVVLTSVNKSDQITRFFEAGADDYVTKPFDSDLLLVRSTAVMRRYSNPARIETAVTDRAAGRFSFDDSHNLPGVPLAT